MNKFDVGEFRKWMKDHPSENEQDDSNFLESKVVSRFSVKKLVSIVETEEDDVVELVENFKKSGGKVIDIEGNQLIVRTKLGDFSIKKRYVEVDD